MDFWKRVENICEEKEINKKEIAKIAGLSPSAISKGLSNGNAPSADKAVKIAQFLGTTVEYLVTGTLPNQPEMKDFSVHSSIIHKLDSLPPDARKSLELFISDLSFTYRYRK